METESAPFTWVEISNPEGYEIPPDSAFCHWVGAVLQHHGKGHWQTHTDETPISIKIVSPDESRALNHTYRGKNAPTNILSFPAEFPPDVECPLLGDLAICADVVAREAYEQNKPLQHHWAHLVIHGVLHLLGYDHIETTQARRMESLEIAILADMGIKDPYKPSD